MVPANFSPKVLFWIIVYKQFIIENFAEYDNLSFELSNL